MCEHVCVFWIVRTCALVCVRLYCVHVCVCVRVVFAGVCALCVCGHALYVQLCVLAHAVCVCVHASSAFALRYGVV